MFYDSMGDQQTFSEMQKFKNCLDKCASNMVLTPEMKHQRDWNPYTFMGGTLAAISGKDFVVVATDTRMSQQDVNIVTRDIEKIHILSDKVIMAAGQFYGDSLDLRRTLKIRLNQYKFAYQHEMSVDKFAMMLSRVLYYKRFFPYLTGSILAGLNDKGEGEVYSYDPVGCVKKVTCESGGSGSAILQTFFDVKLDQCTVVPEKRAPELDLEAAKLLMRDAFRMVAERESSTGDGIKLVWLQAGYEEPQQEVIPLRED